MVFPPPTIQGLSGDRLHLSQGPIDVVLKAEGEREAVQCAYAAGVDRFSTILAELCAELPVLRRAHGTGPRPQSPVGRRMAAACDPFADVFLTPMAAVAGAVADEVLEVMRAAAPLTRAYVNDGGDIALFCAPGESVRLGIAGDFSRSGIPSINGALDLRHEYGIGGVATSGARGRSLSLGIADSVTVLAADAATADVAATLIANAVDLDHAEIERRPAVELDPDSDLGTRLVTVHVPPLDRHLVKRALECGVERAHELERRGLILAAAMMLQGEVASLGPLPALRQMAS
ncbi:hypothetical protein FHS85_002823 [Rhodoligotrophos appendicifer]|uniref:UPF0280 family protein n=1 Tax=Rhodoligotrophos appendicifer TaxID=987056 RepID=UPI001185FB5B|nr:UPF0280 family protein [Rhodoligotrophos appendicifer]